MGNGSTEKCTDHFCTVWFFSIFTRSNLKQVYSKASPILLSGAYSQESVVEIAATVLIMTV